MANRKISQLTALTTPAAGDYLPIVDISEAADADKNKRITIEELLRGAPDGTAAAPSIAFESDPDSGLYSTGANGLALATGGVGRLFVESSGATRIEGTGGPSLIIKDTDSLSGSSTSYLRFWASDAETGYIGYVGGSNYFINNSRSGGAILLRTEDTERLRITNTGQLSHIGGGTSGSPAVSFNGSAPSNSLVVDSSGRVSIGAASASRTLELHSTVPVLRLIDTDASGTPRAEIGAAGGNLTFAADQGSSGTGGNVIFYAPGATERLRITSDGKLGLGTTSAVAPLTVVAASNNTDIAVFNGSTGTSRGLKLSTGVNFNSDALVIYDAQEATYGSHLFRTRGTNALFIDQSQRVGIGTTSPAAGFGTGIVSLDVNGPIFARGPIASNQTNAGVIQYTANDTTIRSFGATAGTGAIAFKVGGGGGSADTEAARIDSSGRLGLGTSAPNSTANFVNNAGDPSILIANGSATSGLSSLGFRIATSPVGAYQAGVFANRTNSPSAGDTELYFQNTKSGSLSTSLLIDTAGRVGIGSTAPGSKLTIQRSISQSPSQGGITFKDQAGSTTAAIGIDGASSNELRLMAGSGDVIAFHTNSDLASTNERARIDSSGRLGLGTSSPSVNLDVQATNSAVASVASTSTNQFSQLRLQTNQQFVIGYGSTHSTQPNELSVKNNVGDLTFYTNVDERVRIDSSGRVGIGSTAPNGKLTVSNNNAEGFEFYPADASNVNKINYYNRNGGVYCDVVQNAQSHQFAISGTEKARIDSSGRLLVGTSTARSNFFNSTFSSAIQTEGIGDGRIISAISNNTTGTAGAYLLLGHQKSGAAGGNTALAINDTAGEITFQGSDGSEFVPAASVKAEVDGTPGANDMPGRLVFSTTAASASSPTERMRITSTGETDLYTTTSFNLRTNRDQAALAALNVYKNATSTATGTICCQIRADGDLLNTNGAYDAISDAKLKENIVDANSQWDDIKAVRIRNWNFKEETGYGTHTQIGTIAQELELVSPGLVRDTPDTDEDGNDLGTTTKSVKNSILYMKAVKALQEAMERIEQLEARLAALEAN